MSIRIERYDHGKDDFWERLGPYFASRDVERELGVSLTSNESHTWWLAFDNGNLVGFAAAEQLKNGTNILRHAWIEPEWRGEGVHERLVDRRLEDLTEAGETNFRVTVTDDGIERYRDRGFEEARTRGQYTILERHDQ
jgi:predicted GNAT family acetyltransferase